MAYDDITHKRWDAIDRSKRSCGKRCANDHVVSLPEREAYWRYQVLGLSQGLGGEDRQDFVKLLLGLDEMAVKAAAMVEAEQEFPVPGSKFQVGGNQEATLNVEPGTWNGTPQTKRHYLELLLILDVNYSREQTARILRHFDEASGRFDWRVPAEDLRWVLDEDEFPDQGSKFNVEDDQAPRQATLNVEPGTLNSDASDSVSCHLSPVPSAEHSIPFVTGPPAVMSPARRQWFIDSPFDKRVCFIRLDGSIGSGLYLHDIPNDQSSVVIWELVEEVIKSEDGTHVSTRGEFPVQGSKFNVGDEPAPEPATWNLEPGTVNSWPLTDELRQELFRKAGPEGMVVLTHDGHIYTGKDLNHCGLVQRGILFLRELCHSTPPWGESIWRTFEPNPPPPPSLSPIPLISPHG